MSQISAVVADSQTEPLLFSSSTRKAILIPTENESDITLGVQVEVEEPMIVHSYESLKKEI
jgi:hypothetical protein